MYIWKSSVWFPYPAELLHLERDPSLSTNQLTHHSTEIFLGDGKHGDGDPRACTYWNSSTWNADRWVASSQESLDMLAVYGGNTKSVWRTNMIRGLQYLDCKNRDEDQELPGMRQQVL